MHDETTEPTPQESSQSHGKAQEVRPRKRRRKKLPNFLRPGEVQQLVGAAAHACRLAPTPAKRQSARRDLTMVLTMLLTGARVAETCALRVEDLDLDAGLLMIVEGKGGKDRTNPMPARLVRTLRWWLAGRRSGYVFHGPGGRQLSTRAAQLRVTALGKVAGVGKRVKCHTLRHTYACRLLESGAGIHEVSELLGHSNVAITSAYLHAIPERLRGAVNRL